MSLTTVALNLEKGLETLARFQSKSDTPPIALKIQQAVVDSLQEEMDLKKSIDIEWNNYVILFGDFHSKQKWKEQIRKIATLSLNLFFHMEIGKLEDYDPDNRLEKIVSEMRYHSKQSRRNLFARYPHAFPEQSQKKLLLLATNTQ
jgi:hypothetical protein